MQIRIQAGGVFMNDGSKNSSDGYMQYKLSSEQTGGHTRRNGSGSVWLRIIAGMLILYIIVTLVDIFTPKCAHPGCDNEPSGNGDYCALHSHYSAHSVNSYTPRTTTTTRYTTAKTTTYKKRTTKKTTKTTTKKSADPYDVYDYDDPDDFYFDNYEDFYDYEDAEDYFYENRY